MRERGEDRGGAGGDRRGGERRGDEERRGEGRGDIRLLSKGLVNSEVNVLKLRPSRRMTKGRRGSIAREVWRDS